MTSFTTYYNIYRQTETNEGEEVQKKEKQKKEIVWKTTRNNYKLRKCMQVVIAAFAVVKL